MIYIEAELIAREVGFAEHFFVAADFVCIGYRERKQSFNSVCADT